MRPGRRTRKARALQSARERWRRWSAAMIRIGLPGMVAAVQSGDVAARKVAR